MKTPTANKVHLLGRNEYFMVTYLLSKKRSEYIWENVILCNVERTYWDLK